MAASNSRSRRHPTSSPRPGDRLRTTVFELLAPSTNRLVSAYVPPAVINAAASGKNIDLDLYALIEVPRRAEYTDLPPQGFEEVLRSFEPSMGKFDLKNAGNIDEEINARLKALGQKPVDIGTPRMLGGVFKKPNAAGYAMLLSMKQGDRSITTAGTFAVLRVKQRLIFAYLYRRYESPETVTWLRKNIEAWCDAILADN